MPSNCIVFIHGVAMESFHSDDPRVGECICVVSLCLTLAKFARLLHFSRTGCTLYNVCTGRPHTLPGGQPARVGLLADLAALLSASSLLGAGGGLAQRQPSHHAAAVGGGDGRRHVLHPQQDVWRPSPPPPPQQATYLPLGNCHLPSVLANLSS